MPDTKACQSSASNFDIAIVGMACRFPGARNLGEFWSNLIQGVESISRCSEQEVLDSGFHPEIVRDPEFIPVAGKLEGEYMFDAEFFGIAPREAEIMDPQHRLLLECSWEALEAAGYSPESYPGKIGVYAGASTNTYFPFHIAPNHRLLSSIGLLQAITANDKDFLASRVAYKLNLKGPAISVQTACSTSLVAVNLACMSLLNYQCDMVLAGGVSVTPKGRLYKDGFIFSRDGHCRPFDEAADGAVFGNGVGVVVLKRLEDALADGDHIHAVIKSSSINNDGSLKAGYTAPSVTGQRDVITEAQALAGVDPGTIKYVEAHGTGTALGDPIEIAALTQAFRSNTAIEACCAVGSVKGNIGHLDAAAGISGLIKTVLVLEHKQVPPTLHFRKPNPRLNLENGPFFINAELRDWKEDVFPRRAAVSSFGFGGTNAHAILEEAPPCSPSESEDGWHLVPVSARTEDALRAACRNLSEFCQNHPGANLADIAFTLQLGRRHFKKRGFAVVGNCADAAATFANLDSGQFRTTDTPQDASPVVFMFPGQGSQFVNMGRELYESEPLFRETMLQCSRFASRYLDHDLIDIIYPIRGREENCGRLLIQTQFTQPAMFAVEYALARLWQSWGIQPASMIGHSIGEYVAACLAGVFSLEDAMKLICLRAAAMQEQPAGGMMSIPMDEAELRALLPAGLSIAAVNAPKLCVVSGPSASIDDFRALLAARGIAGWMLPVSHAFHSEMMKPASVGFAAAFRDVKLSSPQIPFISNVTGAWITDGEACDPEYWVRHLLSTVHFSAGWRHLAHDRRAVFLEVGPGHVLAALARQCAGNVNLHAVLTSLRRKGEDGSDRARILCSLGNLWMNGMQIEWNVLHHGQSRRRVPLPTYQFQRKKYLLPPIHAIPGTVPGVEQSRSVDLENAVFDQANLVESVPSAQLDELESVITRIWQEVLGVHEIGRQDDFFVLGGHSLMAIQLIAEIRRVTGIEVPVKSLFQEPTVAALARKIHGSRTPFAGAERQAIQPVPRHGDLPLTFHQADVWNFETTMPGTARYTGVITLSLNGHLIHAGLEFAVNEILNRHEVLRTTYRSGKEGRPVAVVNAPQRLSLPVTDISHMDSESCQKELLRSANQLVRAPFDLGRDVFIRLLLFKIGDSEHVLLFSSHYIAVDGWTVGLILHELGEHYAAYVESRLPQLPATGIQCIDYAHWQRSQTTSESLAPHLSYWRRQLSGLASQDLVPVDQARRRNSSLPGSTIHFALTPHLTRSLKHFSHQNGSTLFFTLVSALNALFHALSGSRDIVIGTITGDREPGMEAVFGSFVNCLPLRNRLDPEQTFLELMESVRRCVTDAYAHQVPFHEIIAAVGKDRELKNNPLFRVMLVLRNIPFTEIKTSGLEIQLASLPVNRAVSEGDISLYLQDFGSNLSGYFEYNHEICNHGDMERLVGDFIRLLGDVTATPQSRLCDLLVSAQPAHMISSLVA